MRAVGVIALEVRETGSAVDGGGREGALGRHSGRRAQAPGQLACVRDTQAARLRQRAAARADLVDQCGQLSEQYRTARLLPKFLKRREGDGGDDGSALSQQAAGPGEGTGRAEHFLHPLPLGDLRELILVETAPAVADPSEETSSAFSSRTSTPWVAADSMRNLAVPMNRGSNMSWRHPARSAAAASYSACGLSDLGSRSPSVSRKPTRAVTAASASRARRRAPAVRRLTRGSSHSPLSDGTGRSDQSAI